MTMIIENDDNDEAISVECMCVGGKISDSTLKNCRLSRTLTDVYLTFLFCNVESILFWSISTKKGKLSLTDKNW